MIYHFDKLRWGFKAFPAGIRTSAGYYATVELPDEMKNDARFEPIRAKNFEQAAEKLFNDMGITDIFIRYVSYFHYLEIRFDNAEDYSIVKMTYR